MLPWIPYDFGQYAEKHPNATRTVGDGWEAIRYHGDTSQVHVASTGLERITVVVNDADDAETERIGTILAKAEREISRRGPCNVWGHVTAGSVCTACADPRGAVPSDTAEATGRR